MQNAYFIWCWEYLCFLPIEGSSLLGFFQLKVMVLPVIDSITGVPSGGSGRISENGNNHCQMSKQVEQLYWLVSAALKWQGRCKWTQYDNHFHCLSSHRVHHFSYFLYTISYYRSIFTHAPELVTMPSLNVSSANLCEPVRRVHRQKKQNLEPNMQTAMAKDVTTHIQVIQQ